MYLDDVVLAGIIILVLTCGFLVGVGWFAWKHIQKDSQENGGSLQASGREH
jgi:hypothetical protein